jgi:hypothetical protein
MNKNARSICVIITVVFSIICIASFAIYADETGSNLNEIAKNLPGVYAEKMVIKTIDKVEGQDDTTSIRTYYNINRINLVDEKLISSTSACRSVIKSSGAVTISIPDKTVQGISPMSGEISVSEKDGIPVLNRALSAVPVSVNLTDVMNEELPTDANDPRVFDSDKDGKPGISIDIKAYIFKGKIYAIMKQRNSWEASLCEDGRYRGLIIDTTEQKTIGASSSMFNVNATSTQDPDLSQSSVELVKLENDLTADELIAQIPTLFPEK